MASFDAIDVCQSDPDSKSSYSESPDRCQEEVCEPTRASLEEELNTYEKEDPRDVEDSTSENSSDEENFPKQLSVPN
jgi:hypothetical protein